MTAIAAVGEFFAPGLSTFFLVPSFEDFECTCAQRVVRLGVVYRANVEELGYMSTICGKG